jgi:enamine deaminase RidA (YjgF/YER057c/UK114 family)
MPIFEPIIPGRWSGRLTFSPAVVAGNLLLISGTTATDEDLHLVGPGDIVAQTRRIFQMWQPILAEVGGSFENIVETTDYFLEETDYAGTAAVRREFFDPPYPAATGVRVAGLARPGALIEIKAVAVLSR